MRSGLEKTRGTRSLFDAGRDALRVHFHVNWEVSQIGNADEGVNVVVESHPVGSFTLQNIHPKARRELNYLFVMFPFFFAFCKDCGDGRSADRVVNE